MASTSSSQRRKQSCACGAPYAGKNPLVRAVVVTKHGGPEVLELREFPDPSPGNGELLVDVEAIGVNYRDVYEREGKGTHVSEPPHLAGVEGAGVVAAAGEGVSRFAIGDRVGWNNASGPAAERVVVADAAVALPERISSELAAAVLLQGCTAHYLAVSTYPIAEGDWVIVHAAAGGVGLLLTQIAKRRGGRVIATTSSDEGRAGAGCRRRQDDRLRRLRRARRRARRRRRACGLRRHRGDDVRRVAGSARPRGFMVLYGAASGAPPVEIARLNAKSLFLTRPTLAHYGQFGDELRRRAGEVLERVASGELDVRVGARYPLEDAARAQADLKSRQTTGKLILTP